MSLSGRELLRGRQGRDGIPPRYTISKTTTTKKKKKKKKKDNLVGSKEDMTRSLPELSPSSGIGKDPATSRSSRSLCPSTTGGAVPRRQPHSGHSPFRTP